MAVAALHGRRRDLLNDIHEIQGPDGANDGDIWKHPGFPALRDAILVALQPFPEALAALTRTMVKRGPE